MECPMLPRIIIIIGNTENCRFVVLILSYLINVIIRNAQLIPGLDDESGTWYNRLHSTDTFNFLLPLALNSRS